jgi:hypothetical protein
MITFGRLWENMAFEEEPTENTKAMKAIRLGLNIRDDFWDDFIRLMNSPEAVADLLNLRPDQVSSWGSLVSENLDKVRNADNLDKKQIKRHKVLHTGADL